MIITGIPVKLRDDGRLIEYVTFFGADSAFPPVFSLYLRVPGGCVAVIRRRAFPPEIRQANERLMQTALRPQPMPPAEACCGGSGLAVVGGLRVACGCIEGRAA